MLTEVQETNETMVFEVASETFPGRIYRVDLLYGQGAGYCSCRNHQTRIQPFLDKGGDPFSPEGCCKHTAFARNSFLRQLLTHMANSEEQ